MNGNSTVIEGFLTLVLVLKVKYRQLRAIAQR